MPAAISIVKFVNGCDADTNITFTDTIDPSTTASFTNTVADPRTSLIDLNSANNAGTDTDTRRLAAQQGESALPLE